MYKAIVSVDGRRSVLLEAATPALLGTAIGGAIAADPLNGGVDVVYEVYGPLSRKAVVPELSLVSVVPEDEDTDVALDAVIVFTFTTPIKANKISVATADGEVVAGAKGWNSSRKVLTFTPYANLDWDTEYVVSIQGVIDAYNQSLEASEISFTTEPNPIALVSISPADEATEVALDAVVVITFNNEIKSNDISVMTEDETPVVGTKVWDVANKVMTFTPTSPLTAETKYTVNIDGVVDVYDQELDDTTSEFTTEPNPIALVSISPADEATEVALDAVVVITFNNEIKSNDISVMTEDETPVVGTKVWDVANKVMTFTPTSPLTAETKYTVNIDGVVDVYDQELDDTTSEFTTILIG